jgi:hypothetical protein
VDATGNLTGREQASALNKEQVAPSDAAGGGRLGTLAPYLTRKSGNFMGPDTALAHLQPRFSDPGASKSAAKAHSALFGRIVRYTDL